MNPVESRLLRYFVAVAEELNFTRAAQRLQMAAPPLSRAIAQLEAQLGVRLLERTTRRVTLTAAGKVLLEEAQPALAALDAAVRHAQRAGPPFRRLVLALKADHDGGLLTETIALYERDHADTPVEVLLCGWGEQWEMLHDGRADVALGYDPPSGGGIETTGLLEETQVVALAADHPLAARSTLRRADLDATLHPWPGLDLWTPRSDTADTAPPRFDDIAQLFRLIELQRAVALFPISVAARYPRDQISYRSVEDIPPTTLSLAWRSRPRSLAITAFTKAALIASRSRCRASGVI